MQPFYDRRSAEELMESIEWWRKRLPTPLARGVAFSILILGLTALMTLMVNCTGLAGEDGQDPSTIEDVPARYKSEGWRVYVK